MAAGPVPAMAVITADLTSLPLSTREAIRRQLGDADAAKLALARARQAKICKLYNDLVAPGTTKNGIGPVGMVMDPYLVSYFRRSFGEQCLADPDFVKWIHKEDPSFRVRETGTKVQVGYRGPARSSARKALA